MARPRKEFVLTDSQLEQIKVLARCHCPDIEIAAWVSNAIGFSISPDTLQRRYAALLKEQREIGKSNIRAKQFRMAMEGDRAMLIWVGKQILGQRERTDFSSEDGSGFKVTVTDYTRK